ncbi:hypothetical protein [Clostridium sp.]|uniref:hypothetical protein n=1 Tax=Clostridium sp. TaxID=1506 RepID=UPI001A5D5C20|nr:hypothetical protein [Clostridium sp.]MBK5234098.1 hypothetical protein [Clostridium sp.]
MKKEYFENYMTVTHESMGYQIIRYFEKQNEDADELYLISDVQVNAMNRDLPEIYFSKCSGIFEVRVPSSGGMDTENVKDLRNNLGDAIVLIVQLRELTGLDNE